MNRHLRFCTFLLLTCAAAIVPHPPAHATIGPPIDVDLLEHTMEAQPGSEYHGTLVVTAPAGDTISSISLQAQAWSGGAVEAPATMVVPASGTLAIPFHATPANPSVPLGVELLWNGQPYSFQLDLSPRAYRWATQVLGTVRLEGLSKARWHQSRRRVEPAPYRGSDFAPEARSNAPGTPRGGADKDFSITVTGRLAYTRDDPSSNESAPAVVVGAYGATVEIYDNDAIGKQFIASTTTDEDGYFSETFTWNTCITCEGNPDILVEFASWSGSFTVKSGSNILRWESDTEEDVGAGTLDLGTMTPVDEDTHPALHILGVLTHTWDVMDSRGYGPQHVKLKWDQNNGGSYYNASNETIFLESSDNWSESVIAHEFGHHWLREFSNPVDSDYCNTTCDGGPGCGHCIWCNETAHDAFNEGWPDWLGAVMARDRSAVYGVTLTNTNIYKFETLPANCTDGNGNPCTCTAAKTEGFIAALLNDLEDGPDDDNNTADPWQDDLTLGMLEIFQTVAEDNPTTSRDFVDAFAARFPQYGEKFWKLATDIGFGNLDDIEPTLPTTFNSPSHDTGVESANPVIELEWSDYSDDYSGVMGFSVQVNSGPVLPFATTNVVVDGAPTASFTTGTLAPGAYVINVRTVDRAGNWSGSFQSVGPFLIREPLPADLASVTPPGWSHPLVPRDQADALVFNVQVSGSLPGDSGSTYWSAGIRNVGDLVTDSSFYARIFVDGKPAPPVGGRILLDPLAGQTTLPRMNQGPINVRGGRHHLAYRMDSTDVLPEADEEDNRWGQQLVWRPETLSPSVRVVRAAPPDPQGGHQGNVLFVFPNCDGVRLSSISGEYHAVVAWTGDASEDYDLELFPASTAPTNGFTMPTARSERGPGRIDAVLVDQNSAPQASSWDVGIFDDDASARSEYAIQHVVGEQIFRNVPVGFTMNAGDRLALRYMQSSVPLFGANTVMLRVDPAAGRFHIGWFDVGQNHVGLEAATATAQTDAAGVARLSFDMVYLGTAAVVVWRDPADDPVAKAAGAVDIDLAWTAGLGDLYVPATRAGWYATLAPTPVPVTAPAQLANAPAGLVGGSPSTYFNLAINNAGVGTISSSDVAFLVDGTVQRVRAIPTLAAGEQGEIFDTAPAVVSGGRHTLGEVLDYNGEAGELYESNNRRALQYVWSGVPLNVGQRLDRPAPPPPTGGWSDIPGGGGPLWYACDGLNLPVESAPARFQAVAVLPAGGGDVDVRLHEAWGGIYVGFAQSLAHSGWGTDESDFIVIDTQRSGNRALDVGVIDADGSAAAYSIQRASAQVWGAAPLSTPAQAFGGHRIVDLHQVELQPGHHTITVESIEGSVDWGVALHPNDETFVSKSNALGAAAAWLAGPGQSETATVQIETAGSYCVSVWRVGNPPVVPATGEGSAKAPISGTYVLHVSSSLTAVEPGVPPAISGVAGLRGIAPNPFNPSTTVSFEIDRSGPVQLELFSARGERVRRLVDQVLPAGEHAAHWDGCDDAGQPVASGTYLVRLRAGGVTSVRKALLAK